MKKFNWKLSLFGVCFTWLINLMLLVDTVLTIREYVVISSMMSVGVILIANIEWFNKEKLF